MKQFSYDWMICFHSYEKTARKLFYAELQNEKMVSEKQLYIKSSEINENDVD